MKTKLQSMFLGLAIIVGIHQATAQVTNLGIAPVAGGQSLLFWPNSPTNYVLQTVTNLTSTNWLTARTAFAINTAEVTNTAPSGFFRLLPTTTPAGMALIPAGWFTMGDTLDGESDATPTNIYVSAFIMDVNLVNYGLWTNVYDYAISQGYTINDEGANGGTGTNYPVETVDWFDCVKWSNARSAQAGLTPVYYTDAGFTQVYTNGDNGTMVYQNLSANGYRLPTEAEWEKSARGGGIGLRFPWGNLIHTNQAQYTYSPNNSYDLGPSNSPSGPSPVGSFDVNGYGLYDMAGNVLEWCWDWYGTPYGQPSTINPTGASSSAPGFRVCRGGAWDLVGGAFAARCAYRIATMPGGVPAFNYSDIGFRCVRGL
jgi:formylglycine-generating enzyme required for sulfatase activity